MTLAIDEPGLLTDNVGYESSKVGLSKIAYVIETAEKCVRSIKWVYALIK